MPRKLRTLSGEDVIKILEKEGFTLIFAKGSHCKLVRNIDGDKQVIVFPRHAVIAKGTLKAIYTKALSYLSEEKLRSSFYTE